MRARWGRRPENSPGLNDRRSRARFRRGGGRWRRIFGAGDDRTPAMAMLIETRTLVKHGRQKGLNSGTAAERKGVGDV